MAELLVFDYVCMYYGPLLRVGAPGLSKHIRALLSTVVNAMSALLAEVDQQREEDERLRTETKQQVTFLRTFFIVYKII